MKTILVLGGSSDIGVAAAEIFAANKCKVYLAGRNMQELAKIAGSLASKNSAEVSAFAFDATRFATHPQFYNSLPVAPDVCVCVFGYLGNQEVGASQWTEAENIIDVNFKGAVSILNIVAADFEKKKRGVIIGISSVAGDRGRQSNYLYGSAKAGFTAYLSGLRNRLFKSGVNVVTVKPGFVDTKMTKGLPLPQSLTAKPQQVGQAIYRAASSGSSVVYVLGVWRLIMFIIRSIPEFIFKRLKL